MDRLERAGPRATAELGGGEHAVFDLSVGACPESGQRGAVAGGGEDRERLARAVWIRAGIARDFRGGGTLPGDVLSGSELDPVGNDGGPWPHGPAHAVLVHSQDHLCLSAGARFPDGSAGRRIRKGKR